jgi:hypothetical protein
MTTKFECTSFDELVLIIEGIEFKYSECQVMSERESKRFPNVELVLKSPCGHFAEALVSSQDSDVGKSNIVRGEYDGLLIEEDVALSLAKLAKSY